MIGFDSPSLLAIDLQLYPVDSVILLLNNIIKVRIYHV